MSEENKRRQHTKTRSFGSGERISHDASPFYESKLYGDASHHKRTMAAPENPIPSERLDQIYAHSSEQMTELPDNSVHLLVTSPPYNAHKSYDEDLTLDEYRALLRRVFAEAYRKLVTGGRACVNIANLGRKPYIPLHSFIIADMIEIGYLMRGEIIWDKGASAGASTAWGSWMSAANPVLRDVHEYILVFSKGSFKRVQSGKENSIDKDSFLAWTKSIWTIPTTSARKIGHPAPFPEELPHRCIQLYTFKGDIILDPFCGSGTTCMAALQDRRHFIGYETEPAYVTLAERRIQSVKEQIAAQATEQKE